MTGKLANKVAIVTGGSAGIGLGIATALAEARPHFDASYEIFADWGLFTDVLRAGARHVRGAELRRGRLIIGGPEDCLEQIAACRERVPIGCLVLRVQWMGMPQAQVARLIELVGARRAPELWGLDVSRYGTGCILPDQAPPTISLLRCPDAGATSKQPEPSRL